MIPERDHAISLSNRQYSMLKGFAALGPGHYISMKEAGRFNQTTFGSLLHKCRKYVAWNSRGFYVTRAGFGAISRFETADILRRVASMELSALFTGIRLAPKKAKAA